MTTYVSDDEMRAGMATTKAYTAVILLPGPEYGTAEAAPIVWEHGRRNFGLRADGVLDIVCPVTDGGGEVCGIGIFNADLEATRAVMAEDPGVKAGVFTFTAYPVRSFPGDQLH
ncbi:hypothetical protein J4573_27585 [Actinomadura barringtoniae]|uniref:YCII-related domain-containing protein n=1 Tax=Actinomadura barringtoniae TaxID=1427535 RepID=A0A939PER9_9ACTN|nr:hypothetical protein [Actinomadura barringtoniae]MBO2450887.1 hypothetical protein [Actinomadura barringtoniae]